MKYYGCEKQRTAIKRSKINKEAMDLVGKHYNQLYKKLVNKESDQDIFNDTLLSISYKYDPSRDFIEQFVFHFKTNQIGVLRENKIRNYLIKELPEAFDAIDDEHDYSIDATLENNLINELKNASIKSITKEKKKKQSA